MECDIKCLECGKRTLRFELGAVIYEVGCSSPLLVKDALTCPKCKKDISKGKCQIKIQDIMGRLIAANILDVVPSHLQRSFPVRRDDFRKARMLCKSVLQVEGRE